MACRTDDCAIAAGCATQIGFLGFWIGLSALCALWTGRSLDWLCTHFAGHAVHVPFWLDWLATFVLSALWLPFNVIVEIIRIFVP